MTYIIDQSVVTSL